MTTEEWNAETRCKHGNGPNCQQCQYERDAERYPEPWRLWEFLFERIRGVNGEIIRERWYTIPFATSLYPDLVTIRRRPDADEIISEWERENNKKVDELRNTPFPDCSKECSMIKILGAGECDSVCPEKFSPDKCAHWLWRPCPPCRGRGTTDCYEWDEVLKKDKVQICGYCNGTGHDGSGLGRCGLIRG